MNKIYKITGLIVAILTIADIILRNIESLKYLDFLTIPLFSINVLEIIIIILALVLGYKLLPKQYNKYKLKQRANNFYNNWLKFKELLKDHYNGKGINSQEKYSQIRELLEKDFNYFLPEIKKIQENSHRDYNKLALSNFEQCFSPRKIAEWKQKVRREIPNELDCFDYLIVGLSENIKVKI